MTDRERFEEWAKLNIGQTGRCTEPGYTHQYQDSHTQMAWIAWDAATKAEREACAELLEQQHTWISNVAAANLVRERSNEKVKGRD